MDWFSLFQSAVLVATLAVAISALRSSGSATKGNNRLAIVTNNREIWSQANTNPELRNVLRPTMAAGDEVSIIEFTFAIQVISHMAMTFELAQAGSISPIEGARRDVQDTMSYPVFKAVWDNNRKYRSANFVQFVDSCLAGVDLDKPLGKRPDRIYLTARTKFRSLRFTKWHTKETLGLPSEEQRATDSSPE
jgi:hypothetical protein